MNVKIVSMTTPVIDGVKTAEELIVYCARVSNPDNQLNMETAPKLLAYLIKKKHWSPFEMADICFEIKTSRGIAAQILRHKSSSFQEFSQRYSKVTNFEPVELRLQGKTNRQVGDAVVDNKELSLDIEAHINRSNELYNKLINNGIAKESARFVLPLNTQTTLYMKNNIRGWIHYLDIRCLEHTQKEHREVANAIKVIFIQNFPDTSKALGWI